ncbi:unnamed protein product [Eruca vesicaria subsp. sativa]|uniref:Uncharacterized protein n=1 Tax=Eruca vesicaria subsp. sativa TaxID=29727 RepID=A0ABC8J9Q9_ERUVS|nr:unnamed protein product [Eruca vesicaria subsp. sativa]
MALYFLFFSDLFSEQRRFQGLMVSSVGYFLADLGMITWLYTSLGGPEYVKLYFVAKCMSQVSSVGYFLADLGMIVGMITWLYTSLGGPEYVKLYFVAMCMSQMARIVLFIYMFYHVHIHYDQIVKGTYENSRDKTVKKEHFS